MELMQEIIEGRMRGKQTRGRIFQMVHDLANDGAYVALKWAAEDGEGWRRREKPAVQQKTTDDDDDVVHKRAVLVLD